MIAGSVIPERRLVLMRIAGTVGSRSGVLCSIKRSLHIQKCFLLILVFLGTARLNAEDTVSFNRDIRPILADRCFVCHGPDSAAREADLRFDQEQSAKGDAEGSVSAAIIPGEPESSEMMVRMLESDPELKMPPPESNLTITGEEIALIRRWITQGAKWEKHWSLIPPEKKVLPSIRNRDWPRNAIDHFILNRLETLGLDPSETTGREHWLRRVTFDLTGLPPTIRQLDEFLADDSQNAYEDAVDRLLQSDAYGERMAQEWLDVARYGDTDGLFEDHPRSIYPWRDWVIGAFNQNLSYRDFISWQVAGDLMPNATIDQRVATGFLRNNPTSNEGGIIAEDYRVKYLVDRVNTTATAIMGLTLECAQCHDHKYDPMTQREYYQFAGFFNSLVGNGNTKGAAAPTLRRYTQEQAARMPVIDDALTKIEAELKSTPDALKVDFEKWVMELDRPVNWISLSAIPNVDIQPLDDWVIVKKKPVEEEKKLPDRPTIRGRFVRLEMPKDHDGFLTISEVQVFSAGSNIARTGKATQSSVGYNSPASKAIDGNHNGSFASCSCTNSERHAWWELDLGGEFEIDSVAVWNRTDCCPERLDQLSIKILDSERNSTAERLVTKSQQRNALPADAVDAESGARDFLIDLALPSEAESAETITAFQLESKTPLVVEMVGVEVHGEGQDGQPQVLKTTGDKTLKLNGKPVVVGLEVPFKLDFKQTCRLKLKTTDFDGIRIKTTSNPIAARRESLPKDSAKRLEHFRSEWIGFSEARKQRQQLLEEKKKIDAVAPLTMIASDMSSARENYVLMRGEYDNRGDVISTAAPASVMPYAKTLPKNRLGLARWLTDPSHPLTARVAVNRYWQMIFGRGIVKTSEDFGTQGAAPTHQELLDYLAVDFIESGWDVKRLLRMMVLSETYRQSSRQSAQNRRIDPENQWLARGPRRRLPAEFVRDHALSISGLLTTKIGGPGVHPYQPAELFGANAIGSSNARFTQGTGDDLYRRSLYTYWKRQIPAANMRILGADGRTTCRTRREQTNTPLQALVLLNDPQFVEAARIMAGRIIVEGGNTPRQRLSYAFRLATSRKVTAQEREILVDEYQDRLRVFQANAKLAEQYLDGGGQKQPDVTISQSELAAYAGVCSLILNLDESISSN